MGSEPLGNLLPFLGYALLLAVLALHWRVPLGRMLGPALRLSPVLLLIAAGLPLSRLLDRWLSGDAATGMPWGIPAEELTLGLSLFLRALCAVVLLGLLMESTGWVSVQRGLRRFHLPAAIPLVLDQLERYRQLIAAEWRRTMLARESRSPGGTRFALASYSGQVGMVFLRSWERAARVHAAMLARGYTLESHTAAGSGPHAKGTWWWLPRPWWLPVVAVLLRLALSSPGTRLAP